jgi:BlaI family penicillinase repressor
LRQLEAKGAVGHEANERTFVFFPRLKEDRVKRTAARELLDRVFGGDVGSLVAHLLKNEQMSRGDLDELHRLIDEYQQD